MERPIIPSLVLTPANVGAGTGVGIAVCSILKSNISRDHGDPDGAVVMEPLDVGLNGQWSAAQPRDDAVGHLAPLEDLAEGRLSHRQIVSEGGHGAYIRETIGFSRVEMIVATGPRRRLP